MEPIKNIFFILGNLRLVYLSKVRIKERKSKKDKAFTERKKNISMSLRYLQ